MGTAGATGRNHRGLAVAPRGSASTWSKHRRRSIRVGYIPPPPPGLTPILHPFIPVVDRTQHCAAKVCIVPALSVILSSARKFTCRNSDETSEFQPVEKAQNLALRKPILTIEQVDQEVHAALVVEP